MALTENGKRARREYQREWEKKNREKRRKWHDDYWNRRGEELARAEAEAEKRVSNEEL